MRLSSLFLLLSFSVSPEAVDRELFVTYTHGVLRVTIPDDAPRRGEGRLTIDILDPEDRVAFTAERAAHATPGRAVWRQDFPLRDTLGLEDLVWHRLRYRYTYEGERAPSVQGIASISKLLRLPVVQVFAQSTYLSGSAAAIRLLVSEQGSGKPVRAGSVSIELAGENQPPRPLFHGKLTEHGSVQAHFRFPAGLSGSYSLRYAVDTDLGPVQHTQPVRIEARSSILLTTEKPLYQPGQTIHARALGLDSANHAATGSRALTFELEDSRGNKVFRKATRTDDYGVAAAEFTLADEVNLGAYRLRALLEGKPPAETVLRVERYVLPRFKVTVELSKKGKRGYRPGDTVSGTVRANYFFGKPVAGAAVVVRVSEGGGTLRGITDRDGTFPISLRLPDSPGIDPAIVTLEATVKDTASHSETRAEPITVSASPLLVTAIPESGELISGLENQMFLIASYPDGSPAQADLRVEIAGLAPLTAATDRSGLAMVTFKPTEAESVRIEARDGEGNRTAVSLPLITRFGHNQILLRSSQGVYRTGERMRLQVYATQRQGRVFIDAVRNGQVVGLYEAAIANGVAMVDIPATADLAGTVAFTAYLDGRHAQPAVDQNLVFIHPPDDLRIHTDLDQSVYKPGGEARIGFRVTNSKGEGVQAALGLEIVDQAVFALAEKQPGFAKVFFYLEQELLKPRQAVPTLSWPQVISSAEPLAARVLFAAAQQLPKPAPVPASFGGDVPRQRYAGYASRYSARLREDIDELASSGPATPGTPQPPCDRSVLASRLRQAQLRDAWGVHLRVEPGFPGTKAFAVRSAGPDGMFQTDDDLVQVRADRYCTEPDYLGGGRIELRFENFGRSPQGMAEVSGTVADPTGAVIPRATITLTEAASGKSWTTASSEAGGFTLPDLPSGEFRITIDSPGFRRGLRRFALSAGDHAIFSAALDVGDVTQTVEVTAAAPLLMTQSTMVSAPKTKAATRWETHVRTWFPESLYVAPRIITDGDGRASITVPIADSITTWRMAMLASSKQGALGAGTGRLKVFQDFFVELDLPVVLAQGDRVSLPVAVYNYSGSAGQVRLRLQQDDWFSMPGDTAAKTIAVENDRVAGAQFTLEARSIGKFKLTLMAEMNGAVARKDIVVREIEVVPNGREHTTVRNGRLTGTAQEVVAFPADAIAGASTVFVRLYPGPVSQVVEGMDAILQMPYGCFEQTSSATYPNVLALAYLKESGKLTPEIRDKAIRFIAQGYQRLLTFEAEGGGFSWFGNTPANKILTAYGLMEFHEMSQVYEIDLRVIARTQQWLAGQQQPDGSWQPDTSFINEGVTNRYNQDRLRITAYIAWALQSTGYAGPELAKAMEFIRRNATANHDAYTLAVVANLVPAPGDGTFARQAMQQLLQARQDENGQTSWTTNETGLYATGDSAAIETTGLAVQALLKSGAEPAVARNALAYIAARKDAHGTWGTTQATILALKALLLATRKAAAQARGTVEVTLNGAPAGSVVLTDTNADLFHQLVLKPADSRQRTTIGLRFQGVGDLAYQVAGRSFVPYTATPPGTLSLDVNYSRTQVVPGAVIAAKATVRSQLPAMANMVMLELGIPPGFELLREDLESHLRKTAGRRTGRLEKFTVSATRAILYFDSLAPGAKVTIPYRLQAKYPIRAASFPSRVYQYYDPAVSYIARPVAMEVRER